MIDKTPYLGKFKEVLKRKGYYTNDEDAHEWFEWLLLFYTTAIKFYEQQEREEKAKEEFSNSAN